jgi:hypothetical protein
MDSQNYERLVHKNEEEQLAYYSEKANIEKDNMSDEKLFLNMSIRDILKGVSVTFIDLINDLVAGKAKNSKDLVKILFRGDRMIYVGVITILIAFGIYIVDITS